MSFAKPNALAESKGESRRRIHLHSIPWPRHPTNITIGRARCAELTSHIASLHRTTMTLRRTFLHAWTTNAASRTPKRPKQIHRTANIKGGHFAVLRSLQNFSNPYPPNLTPVATTRGQAALRSLPSAPRKSSHSCPSLLTYFAHNPLRIMQRRA